MPFVLYLKQGGRICSRQWSNYGSPHSSLEVTLLISRSSMSLISEILTKFQMSGANILINCHALAKAQQQIPLISQSVNNFCCWLKINTELALYLRRLFLPTTNVSK